MYKTNIASTKTKMIKENDAVLKKRHWRKFIWWLTGKHPGKPSTREVRQSS